MSIVAFEKVSKNFGDVPAVDQCSFTVSSGQIVSLLGPSGCGKTTTLRLIAGFETPDAGTINIGGQAMKNKRPYERNVGLLFQDYALFPHMTVEENIGYGLRQRRHLRSEIKSRTAEMLRLVKLADCEKRRPAQLSGGQQQRVALARALATRPEVLLLDEPLSALDARLRQELQVELKEILRQAGITSIVVTHDQEEAMSLADFIFVMNQGQIIQRGTPEEIYAQPRSKFVAEFVGRSNWFRGILRAGSAGETATFITEYGDVLQVPAYNIQEDRRYEVCVRPERIAILDATKTTKGCSEDYNSLRGIVVERLPLGREVHVAVSLIPGGDRISVLVGEAGNEIPARGSEVTVIFRQESCILLPVDDC